ncbi:hypothetical protein C0991_000507 [Blastosporella zonata]|nr:hypothetical protein C0991_000507 [Blastosporella zonata]
MGRPRKYHTAEEIRQAKCKKSKRWYDKSKRSVQGSSQRETTHGEIITPSVQHVNYWNSQVDCVSIKLEKLFQEKGAQQFIQDLYDQFLQDLSTGPFDDAIAAASPLQTSIYRYLDEILNISGVGTHWRKADVVRKRVCDAIRAMQEVIVEALMDIDELKVHYARKSLLFQSLE